MPLSYPKMERLEVDGEVRWNAWCRTCRHWVCTRHQVVKAAVEETRRAHGFEADCRRAPQLCEWYAGCVRPAVGVSPHPVLGTVPICQECADKHGLQVIA